MHNAAFDALELDWVYVAFPVRRGEGAAAVRAVATLGLAGPEHHMPHKADAAAACHDLSIRSCRARHCQHGRERGRDARRSLHRW